MKKGYWYWQTVCILAECLKNLAYGFEQNVLDEDEIKKIDFKARELADIIPDFDEIFERKNFTNKEK